MGAPRPKASAKSSQVDTGWREDFARKDIKGIEPLLGRRSDAENGTATQLAVPSFG